MCDPIIDDSIRIEDEPFTKDVVEDFVRGRPSSSKFPSRHYSQLAMSFDEELTVKSLKKFGIPTTSKALIFGGYTGQFARSLKRIGMEVVFTDPMTEWVEAATKTGFESYRYSAEEMPWSLIQNAQLIATFECYIPFSNERSSLYTTLRFLTPDWGMLFCESQRTREELGKEVGVKRMKQFESTFGPLKKVYGVSIRHCDAGDLRLFNLNVTPQMKKETIMDCRIAKTLYDLLPNDATVTRESISRISGATKLDADVVLESLRRLFRAYRLNIEKHGSVAQYYPRDEFWFFAKRFKIKIAY
jgi:hypothetical protein